MFRAHDRPRRGIHNHICSALDDERARHFWKTQIITNTQPDVKLADCAADEFVPARKTNALIQPRGRHQMSLTTLHDELAPPVNHNLRIENEVAIAVRY